MLLYEYPFNEGIRTMLRLEHLFGRLDELMPRDAPVDHHYALATLFEIMDVAARADLKSDLLKDLDRHRTQLMGYRGNPAISEAALEGVIARIDTAWQRLNQLQGKAGQT
ncbi:MAG: cell division protein ZapD, partial [Rubrivivax sp.]|nr:cell division protein ZapD [Rubrivivax sp.]